MGKYSESFLELVKKYKNATIEFQEYKAVTLAMWLLESARGKSKLALHHRNYAGMKYNSIIRDLCTRIIYESSGGSGYYCEFETSEDFIKGFWGFLEQDDFDGWKATETPLEFLLHIADSWSPDPKYSSKVINLLPEATELLNNAETETHTYVATDDVDADDNFLIPGRPSIILSDDAKIAEGSSGLEITYQGVDDSPYGISATRNKKDFAAIIIHHTAPKHSTEWYVRYQINGDSQRGGHFGYHFYISPEGKIIQGAPLTKRTNHISPKSVVRKRRDIQNTNAIGISCVGAGLPQGFSPTNVQVAVCYDLVFALCDLYDIPFGEVFGHGEIQTNRHRTEGTSTAKEIRGWNEITY